MLIDNIFNFKRKCLHERVSPEKECAYCPDCGKLIINEWYITRCSCCGVKLKTMIKNGHVVPQFHYCSNCGGKDYSIEKLESINFIDINFAALVKKVAEDNSYHGATTTQCWQERTPVQPKLLVQYL